MRPPAAQQQLMTARTICVDPPQITQIRTHARTEHTHARKWRIISVVVHVDVVLFNYAPDRAAAQWHHISDAYQR